MIRFTLWCVFLANAFFFLFYSTWTLGRDMSFWPMVTLAGVFALLAISIRSK
jgi:hypothetical protein